MPCLPRNLHFEVQRCLPQNLHFEVHKILRLLRYLHSEVHKVLCLPRNLQKSYMSKSHDSLHLPRNQSPDDHHYVQSATPATKSQFRSKTAPIPCTCHEKSKGCPLPNPEESEEDEANRFWGRGTLLIRFLQQVRRGIATFFPCVMIDWFINLGCLYAAWIVQFLKAWPKRIQRERTSSCELCSLKARSRKVAATRI